MTFALAAVVGVALLTAATGKALAGERGLPALEAGLALWLLSGLAPLGAAVAAGIFLGACAVVLVPMAATDPSGDCGCFGALAPASPLRALNRVAALLAATVAVGVLSASPSPAGAALGVALVLAWRGGELLSDRLRAAALT